MELVIMVAILTSIFLSAFLAPCSSLPIIQPQSSYEQARASLPALPRKLGFTTAEVNVITERRAVLSASISKFKRQNEDVSGNYDKALKKKEVVMHRSRGTWREWVEGTDTSDYFTMDYSRVKRRRPIHNKSIPVVRP